MSASSSAAVQKGATLEAVSISLANRLRARESDAQEVSMTFTATRVPSGAWPRYTTPWPPLPIRATIS